MTTHEQPQPPQQNKELLKFPLVLQTPDGSHLPKLLVLGRSELTLPQGRANETTILYDQNDRMYVWKVRKDSQGVMNRTTEELAKVGFLSLGGSFEIRTLAEEVAFMENLHQSHLQSVTAVTKNHEGILLPFVEAEDLREVVKTEETWPITQVLDDLLAAHAQGLVYGDRWPQNILVLPNNSILQIDFDLAISGKFARELELAQFLYGAVRDAKNKEVYLAAIENYFSRNDFSDYDLYQTQMFIWQYLLGYKNPDLEQVVQTREATQKLIAILN